MKRSDANTCPLCGAGGSFQGLESHVDRGATYYLYGCPTCLAQWWEPLKNPGAGWYESDTRYASRNSDPILTPNEKHTKTVSFFGSKHGSVLDVGCGVGNFLAWAEKHGWEACGIDFDRDAIEAGKRTFGLDNLEVNDVGGYAAHHPDVRFDLVTFFDVFEHIDNHNEFIETVRGLLKQDGHIALTTPYRGAWRFLVPHDVPPRHLTRWDIESLSAFLQRHGFLVRHAELLPASISFLVMKFRFRYGRAFTFGLVQKAKDSAARQSPNGTPPARHFKVRVYHALAYAKDFVLFGLPALAVWLGLLFTKKRNTDLLIIAQRKDGSF